MSTAGDDEPDLPAVANDAILTGAAADSGEDNERRKGLPRILRYAALIINQARHIEKRLIAEINELCTQLPENAAWAAFREHDTGLALAAELDRRAAVQNEPNLRSLADCVRLMCLPMPRDAIHFDEYRRVGKALVHAFSVISRHAEQQLCCDLERFTFGWAALPVCTDLLPKGGSAAMNAALVGSRIAEQRIAAVKAAVWREARKDEERRRKLEAEEKPGLRQEPASAETESIPNHHLVVVRISSEEMKNPKLKDILGPLKSVINTPLPLAGVPPLREVRSTLLFEFPHAVDAIDFALGDLVGRITIRLRPLLLVGDPGAGKSRFARRLGETLGVFVWREDASSADGAVFGGTARRWYSAEPCHSFLAIAQAKIGNPIVLIDDIEKAPTRSDYGRLWDCLLALLEPETNVRYPDPALLTTLDLSQVSYLATANNLDSLPSPIRDRFRVITFPKPTAGDLNALLPAVIADLARERGLDRTWILPLDGIERTAIAQHWHGGSVRRLRRIVEVILRERDLRAPRN